MKMIMDRAVRDKYAKQESIYGHWEYEDLLDELATTRATKVVDYGPSLQKISNWEESSLIIFANIGRKWRRLERLLWTIPLEEKRQLEVKEANSLRETLLDMANYCLYGVQMLDKFFGQPRLERVPPQFEKAPFFIEQVAIVSKDPLGIIDALTKIGVDEWTRDTVVAKGRVGTDEAENEASLYFNYQLGPFEFEILNYKQGKNWLDEKGIQSGLSHLGVHVKDIFSAINTLQSLGHNIAQEVITQSHTNPKIKDRRYHYCILDTREAFGFDLKLIQRLPLLSSPEESDKREDEE